MSVGMSVRTTPWVARFALGLAAAFVMLQTVFTSETVSAALRFDTGRVLDRPWTFLTYPLVHESFPHLAVVLILLLLLGPLVERRLGSRVWIIFLVYCTVLSAGASLVLAALGPVSPMSGGLAPVLGLAFAHAWFAEDDEISLEPFPAQPRVRLLIGLLAAVLFVASFITRDSALSVAHLAGAPAAWFFLRLRPTSRRPATMATLPTRRVVMAPIKLEVEAATSTASAPPSAAPQGRDLPRATSDEVNRVLDKISALGMASLTEDERRILTEYAENKRRGDTSR